MTNAASPIRAHTLAGAIHGADRAAEMKRVLSRSMHEGVRTADGVEISTTPVMSAGEAAAHGGATLGSTATGGSSPGDSTSPRQSHKPDSWLSSLIGAASTGNGGFEASMDRAAPSSALITGV
jgi:hypothetical protein